MLVVIADDDEDWTTATAKWLDGAKDMASVGTKAFNQPAEMISAFERQDFTVDGNTIVFLDLDFADIGASGLETLRAMKEHENEQIRSVPVVIYSRSDAVEEIGRSYASKANSYVFKGSGRRQKKIFLDAVRFWMETAKLP